MRTFREIIIVILFLFLGFKFSYSQWIMQNSYDSIKTITSSCFINENTGWLSGIKGRVTKTTSGGLSWQTINIDFNTDFYSVKFINSNLGFICGNNGKIYKSTNGGDNWFLLTTNSTDTLHSLDFIDANTGWCVGYHSILRTTNQGANWTTQSYNPASSNLQLYIIKMYSAIEGIVGGIFRGSSGENCYIFRTSNGGINWNFIDSLQGYFPTSINYINQQNVFLSNYIYIYKSTNSGLNWLYNYYLYGSTGESKIKFIDNNTGWAIHSNHIYETINSGSSWAALNTNLGLEGNSIGLDCFAPAVINAIYYKGSMYKTTNWGLN